MSQLIDLLESRGIADVKLLAEEIENIFLPAKDSYYTTTKTLLAALLRVLGYNYDHIDVRNGNACFYFKNKQAVIATLIAYENNDLLIDPKMLIKEFDSIKSTIKGI